MFGIVITNLAAFAGIAGGVFLGRSVRSGKAALALGLIPVVGVYLATEFC
jgi:hypothetical protein